jgi:[acyl-carrier-protein] S-malonyltransferase
MARRLAFAFPGVGVAFCGREPGFFAQHERVMRPILERASERVRIDLAAALRSGGPPPGELGSQVFTYAFGCAVAAVFEASGELPAMTAGYSLGLYAALSVAGAISFDDGLSVTTTAYELMKAACPPGLFDLAVLVGLEPEDLRTILARRSTVLVVNSNNDTSKVVAGSREEIAVAVQDALDAGAYKAVALGVDLPYHHPAYLAQATPKLRRFLGTLRWSRPRGPVISSIDAAPLDDPDALLDLTARHIATPLSWEAVVRRMSSEGLDAIVECGAGVSLTQSARSMDGCPPYVNLRNAGRRG